MLYFALRDENWNTFENHLENEEISADHESFDIRYDCYNERAGVRIMEWRARLSGKPDGSVVFALHGTAKEDFLKKAEILHCSKPLMVQGILPDGKCLALANLTEAKQEVHFDSSRLTLAPGEIRFDELNGS